MVVWTTLHGGWYSPAVRGSCSSVGLFQQIRQGDSVDLARSERLVLADCRRYHSPAALRLSLADDAIAVAVVLERQPGAGTYFHACGLRFRPRRLPWSFQPGAATGVAWADEPTAPICLLGDDGSGVGRVCRSSKETT